MSGWSGFTATTSGFGQAGDRLLDIRERIASGQRDDLHSPSFLATPPTIRHKERIPPGIAAAMTPAWDQIWYPPRPLRICTYENVFVAQEGLVLHPDGEVVAETVEQHTAAEVLAAQLAVSAAQGRDVPRVFGNVVLCRKAGASVYGHWLAELLPKAWFASQLPMSSVTMVQAVGGRMSAIMAESLAVLGIAEGSIVRSSKHPVWVERLITVHGLTMHGTYMSPLVVECLRTISSRVRAGDARSIFVTRPAGFGRGLVDERRLSAIAARAGFVVVDPSTIPFVQQISLFKGARKIVGVSGSALANVSFVQPGAELHILYPDGMPDTFFWFLSNLTGSRLTDVRCRNVVTEEPGAVPLNAPLVLDPADEDIFDTSCPSGTPHDATMFDPAFYTVDATVGCSRGADLLEHYMTRGWTEGRAPSPNFDGEAYLAAYPDVRAAGVNPLYHFLRHGRGEGRLSFHTSATPHGAER